MICRTEEDLEEMPMTFEEEKERKFRAIQTIPSIGASSFRRGIKSIRIMVDRIKEVEDQLWGKGYL